MCYLHPHSPPIQRSVLTREEHLLGGKKTAAAHLTKKTLLDLDLQQLPMDKGRKVESIAQPGLSVTQRSQAILLGARVFLSLGRRF